MRLITRADLDGVTCAVLITTMEPVEQVVFVNPQDIEDGTAIINPGDIIANLPWHRNSTLWFHNHKDKIVPEKDVGQVKGKRGIAPSTARLVWEYYDSPRLQRFTELLEETDRIDSADLTVEDVLYPTGWVLLGYTLDPFMGLSAFHGYANEIIAALKQGSNIDQILEIPEVSGRIKRYNSDVKEFKKELPGATHMEGNVIVTDTREVGILPLGNRFIAFTLFPEGNVQIEISLHKLDTEIRVRLGKSIFDRTCSVHLGRLAAEYDGGGLDGSAGLSLDVSDPDLNSKIKKIIERLKA